MRTYALLALALIACSCSTLDSGDVFSPEGSEEQNVEFRLQSEPISAADGDSVFIGGSFVRSWTPQNFDALEPFGTISEGRINGTYSRPVWAVGEEYTISLWRRLDGSYVRIGEPIFANGVQITALSWSSYAMFWRFRVNRNGAGEVIIDPIQDDRPRLFGARLWTDGIYSQDPDSLFLNDTIGPATPVSAASAWTGLRLVPCGWNGSAWEQDVAFVKPGTYFIRFERLDGRPVFAGCHVDNLTLNHLTNGGPAEHPWWVFAVRVSEDGTIVNDGPPNLRQIVIIGP